MFKLPPDDKTVYHYRVCAKHLSLKSSHQTIMYNIFKTTNCCNKYGPLRIKCASKFSRVMDASYKFDISTYAEKSFYCGKNYMIG